jgi:Fe-S cluster assembly protein SufB
MERGIEQRSASKGEPGWLTGLRLKAFAHYREIGGTLPRQEAAPSASRDGTKRLLERMGVRESEKDYMLGISQVNDKVYMNPVPEGFGKGMIVKPLAEAARENGSLVKKHLSKIVDYRENAYAAYNTAFWDGGVFVYVPKGVRVPFQINVVFIIDKGGFSQVPRALIVCEENTDVKFMEGCVAPIYREYSGHKSITEIMVGKNAKLEMASMQNWSPNVATKGFKRAVLKQGARMKWMDGSFGGSTNHKTLSIVLEGDGANADVSTFIAASRGQATRVVDQIVMKGKGCGASVRGKSLAGGGGRADYSSATAIEGSGCSAFGECECMLLDAKSAATSSPSVTDNSRDSWSSHESSTFIFSRDAIEYLMARGIAEEEAKASMVIGFAKPFTLSLPVEYRRELERLIGMKARGEA